MTLIDDDEVEEVRIEELTVVLLIIVPDKLLVEREVDLVGGDGVPPVLREVHLMDDLLEWGEILLDRLVHEVVAVGEVEDLTLHTAAEQAVNDLEGGVGLAGTGRHDEQDAVLPTRDGVESPVDGITLIVTRRVGGLARVERLRDELLLFCIEALAVVSLRLIARDERVHSREFIHREGPLRASQEVVLLEAVSV